MKALIPQEDFESMKYNPLCKGTVLKTYPELSDCFKNVSDKTQRWIIALFSDDSPIHERETNFNKLTILAADEVGIKINDSVFEDIDVLNGIHEFLAVIDNDLWELIMSTTITFREFQRLIRIPLDSEELDKKTLDAATVKTKLINDSHDLRLKLKSYRKEFYGKNDELEERQKKIQRIRPERVQTV